MRSKRLTQSLKIKEVYNLLPNDAFSDLLSSFCGDKLKVRRNGTETLDQAKRRCVYQLVSNISTPIIVNGDWIGECVVADLYSKSSASNFIRNLQFDHPNALILIHIKSSMDEQSEIKIMKYFFNILRKYGSIKYEERICCAVLSHVITTEYQGRLHLSGHPLEALARHHDFQSYTDLASYFLTEEGLGIRDKLIEEIRNEDIEDMRLYNYDPDPWDADAEMDYIRNNGGDWIDD